MEIKYAVSYGGGVDSTGMIFYLLEQKKPIDFVIFADTGAELPETYKVVKKMTRFLKKRNIELITINPHKNRDLTERCMDRSVIPDRMRKWCTRDVKLTPIFAFYRGLKCSIVQYVGIDAGEKHRVRKDPSPSILTEYPLVDAGIDRKQCLELIKKYRFGKVIKSGCYYCIHNNIERWKWLFDNHLDLFENAIKFEKQSKHYPKQTLFPGMTLEKMKKYFEKGVVPDLKNSGDTF